MTEYIEREAILEKIEQMQDGPNALMTRGEWNGLQAAVDAVLCVPAADVAPVVRCKDCKHRNHTGAGFPWCDAWEAQLFSDDCFCSYGERKDGDDNG